MQYFTQKVVFSSILNVILFTFITVFIILIIPAILIVPNTVELGGHIFQILININIWERGLPLNL